MQSLSPLNSKHGFPGAETIQLVSCTWKLCILTPFLNGSFNFVLTKRKMLQDSNQDPTLCPNRQLLDAAFPH